MAGEVRPLTDARRTEILAGVERLADLALRTLAVAYRPLPDGTAPPAQEPIVERELVYLGMVGISTRRARRRARPSPRQPRPACASS